MKNRNILFGYQYQNGIITIHPQESQICRRIFTAYIEGMSMLKIAEQLNRELIEYMPGIIGWNKARVKRIIEDVKYIGNEQYPAIIDQTTYDNMQKRKEDRNTQKNTNRQSDCFQIDTPVLCPKCGKKLYRCHDNRNKCARQWVCENNDCHTRIDKPDDELITDITDILNTIILNPSLIAISENPVQEMNTEIMRLQNEINRALEQRESDRQKTQKMILQCASLKYKTIDSIKYLSERLKKIYEYASPLTCFSAKLFNETAKNILIYDDGTVGITLINNQHIRKEQ